MKYFIILVTLIAAGLIVFNVSMLDFNNLFEGQSIVALITIFASLCAIILLQVLRFSKRVDQKLKGNA
ncbi:hypothetical protein ES692_13200 [Psychroserpens burtonensis]|uniref:Uncharacterized protein n=1 Tax=Psychroserpens burtonensis TaxID=49278 RepID=A0A5C7B490_9FLAO|nr:hypothetical protein [Psychroserpens burtonensis]TXE16278.1 hypothetical protein ES692_13200 [Psychroserpens burtonensis]